MLVLLQVVAATIDGDDAPDATSVVATGAAAAIVGAAAEVRRGRRRPGERNASVSLKAGLPTTAPVARSPSEPIPEGPPVAGSSGGGLSTGPGVGSSAVVSSGKSSPSFSSVRVALLSSEFASESAAGSSSFMVVVLPLSSVQTV